MRRRLYDNGNNDNDTNTAYYYVSSSSLLLLLLLLTLRVHDIHIYIYICNVYNILRLIRKPLIQKNTCFGETVVTINLDRGTITPS